MDLNTAYHVMDLPEDCSLEDLEKQYYILTEKKITLDQIEDIQTAYNMIKSHINKVNPPPKPSFKTRVGDFFFHYKNHLIFGIIGALVIGGFGYTIINAQIEKAREANRPPADIDIMFFGNYPEDELTPLEDRILDRFSTWKDVDVALVYSPIEVNSEFDIGAMQKSRIELATTDPDLYIFDLYHLELFMEEGEFFPLDEFENEPHTEDRWHLFKLKNDEEEHIYGIDISDLDLFSGLAIESHEKIAVMRLESENEQNVLDFLHTLLQE